jgi:hypothetical protein
VRPTVDAGPVAGHDAFVDEEAAECGEVVVDLAQDVVGGGLVVRPRRVEEGGEEHRESRDNIAYGNPDASEEQILAAARATYVDRFVRSLPDGYDKVIDKEGSNVSAGEQQRRSDRDSAVAHGRMVGLSRPPAYGAARRTSPSHRRTYADH